PLTLHVNLTLWPPLSRSLLLMFPSQSMTMQCHNCAFLTSSGHILGSRVGDEIDHTECVICINDAPTTGYESDVGGHSSVSYVFRNPNEFLRRTDSHSVIIFWGPPYKIRKDPKAAFYGSLQRVSMTYRDISYLTVTPSKMLTFDDLFLRETGYDRTGWFTMVIAIEICDNIKAYGMVPPNHCGQGQHRFITEKRVFARWAKQYNITFTHPRW
uniref:ST6 N-acetylgalactosaminide alpha-2,6-sialyltransferase 6 n=1 Tax=Oreochromis niloticus TaxID=8128 RepID=A0A669CHD6_ORENI